MRAQTDWREGRGEEWIMKKKTIKEINFTRFLYNEIFKEVFRFLCLHYNYVLLFLYRSWPIITLCIKF
jgi:hypothetical protein